MRLFVAIELSKAVKKSLAVAQDRLRHHCNGVRWVRPELMHLTVKFLGEVSDGRVGSIGNAIEQAASRCESFAMGVGECGCFPRGGLVRVVWAGIEQNTGELRSTVEAVEAALESEGFDRESRAYSPHITLGRIRSDQSNGGIRRAVERLELPIVEQNVESVVLMSSVLSPNGPTYTVVSRATLEGSN